RGPAVDLGSASGASARCAGGPDLEDRRTPPGPRTARSGRQGLRGPVRGGLLPVQRPGQAAVEEGHQLRTRSAESARRAVDRPAQAVAQPTPPTVMPPPCRLDRSCRARASAPINRMKKAQYADLGRYLPAPFRFLALHWPAG